MSENKDLDKSQNETVKKSTTGRKRDMTLDTVIIEATLNCLADVGYDQMTMDLVASSAKTGKATMYRRWKSKAELVRDALIHMNSSSVNTTELPDTGSIREDLLAVVKPKTAEQSEKKLRVLSNLGSFFTEYQKTTKNLTEQIFGNWEKVNTLLFKRAIERGEISKTANIPEACKVISAVTAYVTTMQFKMFDKKSYEQLLDSILLPALKAGSKQKNKN